MSPTDADSAADRQQATPLKPMPTLMVIGEGPLHGQRLSLHKAELVVGRRRHSDVCLSDPCVSRTHAVIRREADRMCLEDLGSTGGTWVNEERVTERRVVRHGDRIRFATVLTQLRDHSREERDRESLTVTHDVASDDVASDYVSPLLSERQMEVLSYVNEGLTNPEIAHRLGVTERTVKVHCQEVFDRLGVSNRTAAVVTARRLGLFAVNAATR